MIISRVTSDEFGRLYASANNHIYNTVSFNELNAGRCRQVYYLSAGKVGWILGERDGLLLSPFSAPFGGPVYGPERPGEADIEAAVKALACYGRERGLGVRVTLPPALYYPEPAPLVEAAMARYGRLLYTDTNHHIDIRAYDDPLKVMHRSARHNYKLSLPLDYRFIRLDGHNPDDIARAYEVIRINRAWRGYPLRMTLEQVVRTAPVVDGHFGVLSLEGKDLAAVQMHRVTPGVMQVVYWGNVPDERREVRPMARLVPEVMAWCRDMGVSIVDAGPSSENGVLNVGLAEFKESHGGIPTQKQVYELS